MAVGKNLIFKCDSYQTEYIEKLWNTYITNDDETYIQQEQDIFYGIPILRLYKMFHDKKKTKYNTVTIEYNKQKIEVTNECSASIFCIYSFSAFP
jgi:hypothetical protein